MTRWSGNIYYIKHLEPNIWYRLKPSDHVGIWLKAHLNDLGVGKSGNWVPRPCNLQPGNARFGTDCEVPRSAGDLVQSSFKNIGNGLIFKFGYHPLHPFKGQGLFSRLVPFLWPSEQLKKWFEESFENFGILQSLNLVNSLYDLTAGHLMRLST